MLFKNNKFDADQLSESCISGSDDFYRSVTYLEMIDAANNSKLTICKRHAERGPQVADVRLGWLFIACTIIVQ